MEDKSDYSTNRCGVIRTGTSANCNLTRDRNRLDFTLLVRTRSEKAYLYWIKENMLDPHKDEFQDAKVVSDSRYLYLSFTHRPSQMLVSLNVNNIAGVFNSQLISHFNSLDHRVHRLSIFLLKWHRHFLISKDHTGTQGKPMQLLSVYAVQLMLLTWLQQNGQIAKLDLSDL